MIEATANPLENPKSNHERDPLSFMKTPSHVKVPRDRPPCDRPPTSLSVYVFERLDGYSPREGPAENPGISGVLDFGYRNWSRQLQFAS